MHELSLTEKFLKLVLDTAQQHKARKVTRIKLEIGDLSGIVAEAVTAYFELLARDTIAAGAKLQFRRIPAGLYCPNCQQEFTKAAEDFLCPVCKQLGRLTGNGHDCRVTRIEVE